MFINAAPQFTRNHNASDVPNRFLQQYAGNKVDLLKSIDRGETKVGRSTSPKLKKFCCWRNHGNRLLGQERTDVCRLYTS